MLDYETRKKAEEDYKHLKDNDVIERIARWENIDGENQIIIQNRKVTNDILILSKEISEISAKFSIIDSMFDLIVSDYFDIIQLNKRMKTDKHDNKDDVNRYFIHYLSTLRLFVVDFENSVKKEYGRDSINSKELKSLLNDFYDNNFSYRLCYHLRNFTQHMGFPINSISRSIVLENGHEVINRKADIDINYLLGTNYNWKKELLLELKSLDNKLIDVFEFVEEVYSVYAKLMQEFNSLQLKWNHEKLIRLKDKCIELNLTKYKYSIHRITKYNLLNNPTQFELLSLFTSYDIEKIYINLSKIGLVKINNIE